MKNKLGQPQIGFALARVPRSRENCGLFFGQLTQGDALTDSRSALGYHRSPLQGSQFAALPNNISKSSLL
jgi:hypothetical protein